MSDQCGRCELRGKLHDCLREDCFQHDNWFALAIQEQLVEKDKEIDRLKEEINIIRISCNGCVARKAEAELDILQDRLSEMIIVKTMCHACSPDVKKAYEELEAENAALRNVEE